MLETRDIWILAGESSGDLYGARLADELRRLDPSLRFKGMGLDGMREAGVETLVDATELGVVGLVEVVRHLPTFVAIFNRLTRQAARERPACVVLIDYPGFNLRFARRMHSLGIPIIYYVSPQVWAWGRRRIPKIAKWCRKVLAIFPFEPSVYAGTGLDVTFVGHPLVHILGERKDPAIARDPNLLLLLPGSRRNEIDKLFEPLVETAVRLHRRVPSRRFVLPVPSSRIAGEIDRKLADFRATHANPPEIRMVEGDAAEWFQRADAGLAASGTVTMQAAIYGLPLVSVYKVSPLTYHLARRLVRLPYFTMVNLVAQKRVYEEFLQGEVRPEVLAPAVEAIASGGERRAEVLAGMAECVAALGAGGNSCQRAAQAVLEVLDGPRN